MNPVVQQIIMSLIRSGLMAVAGVLIARGIWTESEADGYVRELVPMLVPVVAAIGVAAWGAARAYSKQKMLVTAQALPAGVSTDEVKAASKSASAPSATLPKDEQPDRMARP